MLHTEHTKSKPSQEMFSPPVSSSRACFGLVLENPASCPHHPASSVGQLLGKSSELRNQLHEVSVTLKRNGIELHKQGKGSLLHQTLLSAFFLIESTSCQANALSDVENSVKWIRRLKNVQFNCLLNDWPLLSLLRNQSGNKNKQIKTSAPHNMYR